MHIFLFRWKGDIMIRKLFVCAALFIASCLSSGCAVAPLLPVVGAAYQGYSVWKGGEVTNYYAYDLETTFTAVKQTIAQIKLETSAPAQPEKGYAVETKGNNPMQITVTPSEKNLTKVSIRFSVISGDKQFAEFFFKNVENNLTKKTTPDTVPVAALTPIPANKIYHGLCFGSYDNPGQAAGSPAQEEKLRDLVRRAAPYTEWLRIYSVTGGFDKIPDMARQFNPSIKIAAGAWLNEQNTRTAPADNEEIKNLISLAKAGKISIAIVGSEATTQNGVSPDTLINYIAYVKDQLKGLPVQVTSGLSWKEANDVRIVNACDVVFVHIYPCLVPVSVDAAVDNIKSAYGQLKNLYKGKDIIIGETGWPSEGGVYGPAVYDLASAVKYHTEMRKWAGAEGVRYFYFEAFDKPWKGSREAKFGIWDGNLNPKAGMIQ